MHNSSESIVSTVSDAAHQLASAGRNTELLYMSVLPTRNTTPVHISVQDIADLILL